jgi:acetyltransferase-like isoleucine patch superfamily enzyme
MFSQIKKIIPSWFKSFFWNTYLKRKYSSGSRIGNGVIFSKDLIIGDKCVLGKNTSFGTKVKLGNCIKIGKDAIIEKAEIDDFSAIEGGVIISGDGKGKVKIGKHCYIGVYNVLDNSNDITIGDFVHIAGPSTGLWTHTSAPMCLKGIPLNEKNEEVRPTAPIVVENNVYIGGNCTIYPGITIGHHSVVAPNSAVTKNVFPFSLVGGVPAKFIKDIKL